MVAAVATEEPQMAPNAALAMTAAMASPPRSCDSNELAKPNRALEMPPWVAKCPIRMNSGMTDRS